MNGFQNEISKMDFDYWKSKNPYYSDVSLSSSMLTGLNVIQGQGYLVGFNPKSAIEIIYKIELEISQFDFKNPNFETIGTIFDLIQAWGGKMGRHPYVISRSRNDFEDWKLTYLESCELCVAKLPDKALEKLVKIEGIGRSFATKHIRFWGKFPILDTRLSLILTGTRNFSNYNKFLSMLNELGATWDCDAVEAEKAIFAFSQYYFPNDKLSLKQINFDEVMDFCIAKKISEVFVS